MKSTIPPGADQLRRALGDNVRRLRRERGLSQRVLADLSGVSIQYVGLVESGRANPRATTVAALAAALNVSPVEMLSAPSTSAAPKA